MYINNDALQYVIKKGKAYSYETVELKQGTVLNGVIIDKAEIESKLRELRDQFKSVCLVIDSSNIVVKRLTVPNLPRKSLEGVIKSEFDMGYEKYYHYDWSVIEKGKSENVVLACAMPEEFLEKYLEVFKNAKIKITKIELATNGMVKYYQQNLAFNDTSMLLNVLRGNMMISILFENGTYRLLNRNRMLAEPGTRAYADEIYSKYTTMAQFSKTQKSDSEITDLYYIGLDSKTLKFLRELVEETYDEVEIHGQEYPDRVDEYFYPYLGFLTSKNDMDLGKFQGDKEKVGTGDKKKSWVNIAVILILIILVAGAWLYFKVQNNELEKEMAEISEYIDERKESGILDDLNSIISGNEEVVSVLDQYRAVATDVEMNNLYNIDLFEFLYKDIDMESVSYNLTNRQISASGYTDSVVEAVDYSEALRNLEYSDTQHFQGYVRSHSDGVTRYDFEITLGWEVQYPEEEAVVMEEEEVADDY